ncbi:hypothetical protein, partial [Bacillus altitudinis]|uniref:hypothetical protein n=1 Tax=Bacillus altitudinis TaxID=293387 RepID=UPI001C92EF84
WGIGLSKDCWMVWRNDRELGWFENGGLIGNGVDEVMMFIGLNLDGLWLVGIGDILCGSLYKKQR